MAAAASTENKKEHRRRPQQPTCGGKYLREAKELIKENEMERGSDGLLAKC